MAKAGTFQRSEHLDRRSHHGTQVATLRLPPPQPRRIALDHDRTEVWSIDRRGLWFLLPRDCREGEVVMNALRSAEQTMHATAKSDANLHAQPTRQPQYPSD